MRVNSVVTSARVSVGPPQADGRVYVRERHTADGGEAEDRVYLALPTDDLDALLADGGRRFLQRLAAGGT